eukprot:UN04992
MDTVSFNTSRTLNYNMKVITKIEKEMKITWLNKKRGSSHSIKQIIIEYLTLPYILKVESTAKTTVKGFGDTKSILYPFSDSFGWWTSDWYRYTSDGKGIK